MADTLFEKIWNSHVVVERENEPSLIYIDRHLVHEVTSPQAFDGLSQNNRKVRRPDLTIATQLIIMSLLLTEVYLWLMKHHPHKLKHLKKTVKILE